MPGTVPLTTLPKNIQSHTILRPSTMALSCGIMIRAMLLTMAPTRSRASRLPHLADQVMIAISPITGCPATRSACGQEQQGDAVSICMEVRRWALFALCRSHRTECRRIRRSYLRSGSLQGRLFSRGSEDISHRC